MNWPVVSLGEAVSFKGGGTPSRNVEKYWNGSIPWATVKDLNSGYSLALTQEFITDAGLQNSASNLIPSGTVIIPTRMALGKAVIAAVDVAINQDLKAVFSIEELDARFLLWYFIANRARIVAMGKGATVKGITLDQLRALQIPLPPLPEQHRIATLLDKADTLRSQRRAAVAKLDELLHSVFIDMFGDPVTNPKGWSLTTIGDECEVGTGSTPSRNEAANFNGEIPWVKSTEVDWGIIIKTSECVSEKGQQSARLKLFAPETVVVALYGQGVTRGKCALLGVRAAMNQACAGISPSRAATSSYIFHLLRHSYLRLRNLGRGGNQENLNLNIIKSFPLPLPPLVEQQKFAVIAKKIEARKLEMKESADKLDELFASLQQRAFSGTL